MVKSFFEILFRSFPLIRYAPKGRVGSSLPYISIAYYSVYENIFLNIGHFVRSLQDL